MQTETPVSDAGPHASPAPQVVGPTHAGAPQISPKAAGTFGSGGQVLKKLFRYTHTCGAVQTVGPVKPWPPHWPQRGARTTGADEADAGAGDVEAAGMQVA